ncbi:aminopeptidase P family protein, partial [Candidatus Bathyarchaeota archaeon]|nr:aminopeptidase P family protein [Candidatus Bathyarchaeota archaeon]
MSHEKLLEGFEPNFEFKPVPPLPKEEFEERVRRIRREATEEELDALLILADRVVRYHPSNAYVQYVCDWPREALLILPIDEDKPSTILSFFSQSILLPPPGEPVWIDDIRSVGVWSRAETDRPGNATAKLAKAAKEVI